MADQITSIDWNSHYTVTPGSPPYLSTPDIELAPVTFGQFSVKMQARASGYAGDVKVTGSFQIFDGDGQRIGSRSGVPVRYSRDLEIAAACWLRGEPVRP